MKAVPDVAAADRFLTRMAWNAGTGASNGIVSFRIDCFLFEFQEGFTMDIEYRFFQFAKTLDLRDQRAVVKLWLWLVQQGVRFHFRFQWNRALPAWYNLKKIKEIRVLKSKLAKLEKQDILAYDLMADGLALHP